MSGQTDSIAGTHERPRRDTIHVCEGCVDPDPEKRAAKIGGGPEFLAAIKATFADVPGVDVKAYRCVGNCARRLRLSIGAPERWGYVFGDLTPADVPDLRLFVEKWRATPDGKLERAERPPNLRAKILGWTPPT